MTGVDDLIAFVHIEKAAGTTFIHIMRRLYFGRYLDVRPVTSNGPDDVFSRADLACYQRLNPWIRCVAGHSIRPFSDLHEACSDVRYVTLLRDPCERYISQFLYWNRRLGKNISFEDFLALPETHDFQVKKICGSADWHAAKPIVDKNFFCIGIVEEFDLFLVTFARQLGIPSARLAYKKQNARKVNASQAADIRQRYRNHIDAVNQQDRKLYDYVISEVLPRQAGEYGDYLDVAVRTFSESASVTPLMLAKSLGDWVLRKVYIEPATDRLRRKRGLPAKGSYARS